MSMFSDTLAKGYTVSVSQEMMRLKIAQKPCQSTEPQRIRASYAGARILALPKKKDGLMMSDVRVIIVADDLIVRAGLAALLSDQAGVRVVGQSAPERAVEDAEMLDPDAIVWDVGWEQAVPSATLSMDWPLLLLIGDLDRSTFPALNASVFALLPRDSPPQTLTLALQALRQGLIVVAPPLLPRLIGTRSPSNEPVETLTNREREVLELLAQGCTNKAIALQLNITEHTVKFHVNAIMSKLGAQSRTDAVIRATRAGLISL